MESSKNKKLTVLNVRNVPVKVIKAVDILAIATDLNRSEYIRKLLHDHVLAELPREMLDKI